MVMLAASLAGCATRHYTSLGDSDKAEIEQLKEMSIGWDIERAPSPRKTDEREIFVAILPASCAKPEFAEFSESAHPS